jgi:hypothetical protein
MDWTTTSTCSIEIQKLTKTEPKAKPRLQNQVSIADLKKIGIWEDVFAIFVLSIFKYFLAVSLRYCLNITMVTAHRV